MKTIRPIADSITEKVSRSYLKTSPIVYRRSKSGFALVEVSISLPVGWSEYFTLHRLQLSHELAPMVCNHGHALESCALSATPRADFPEVWRNVLVKHSPAYRDWIVLRQPCRADVWGCLEHAARSVGCSPHKVALAVLAHNLPLSVEMNALFAAMPEQESAALLQGSWKLRPL